MPGMLIIDKNKLDLIGINEKELNKFKKFNDETQFTFYFIFFKIFSDKYHKLIQTQNIFNYREIEVIYDFLFYFKHIIDTFNDESNDTEKAKNIKNKLYDDHVIIFLIVLRNYLEHNPFKSIKIRKNFIMNQNEIIFKISDVYNSIPEKNSNYRNKLSFLKNDTNFINVKPLIDYGYYKILNYIHDLLIIDLDEQDFENMTKLLNKLEIIETDDNNEFGNEYEIMISNGVDLYNQISKELCLNRYFNEITSIDLIKCCRLIQNSE